MAKWCHMVSEILVNTGSGNGLLPEGIKPLVLEPIIIDLTHWGQVTHICIGNLTIISSDNGLSPGWCQAIIWTNADL